MHNLSIDIGNSFSKVAVFKDKTLVFHQRLNKLGVIDLAQVIEKFAVKKSIISSVNQDISALEEFLKRLTTYRRFTALLSNGVQNLYQTPTTLGLDRWAAILGANSIYPNGSSLVIDAGTCITYDLLNHKKQYFGGSISPGINMRFKAMNHYTGRLPLLSFDENEAISEGKDTETAIKNGVLQGVLNEIEGFIAINNKKESDLKVILTGGDANFLYKQLQNSIFAPQIIKDTHLVLKGLNEAIAD